MQTLSSFRRELKSKSDPKRAAGSHRFFKTGLGEYAEGHVSMGVPTSEKRKIAKKYFKDLKFADLQKLLKSKIHDERQTALFVLVNQFQHAMPWHSNKLRRNSVMINHNTLNERREENKLRKAIFNFYLKNTKYINNWDLVDLSAHKIVGEYLAIKCQSTNDMRMPRMNTNILYKLAKSKNLWEKRIAIISTFAFISRNQFSDTLKISEILLKDKHDLIHKAVGWALREVGKKDMVTEEKFLKKHYKQMPRTTLRYAIEKFPEKKRKVYLNA